jgi:hypothetical protein
MYSFFGLIYWIYLKQKQFFKLFLVGVFYLEKLLLIEIYIDQFVFSFFFSFGQYIYFTQKWDLTFFMS